MNRPASDASLAQRTPACPQCARPLQACLLEGHYGQQVSADLCPHCHLVWFDAFESVRLSGLGWVALLRHMQAAMPQACGPLKDSLECPRCHAALKPVANLNRFNRFAALECPHRHGHLQTFTLLLAERGLVRPFGREDWRALAEEGRQPGCFNCGAALPALSDRCTHCASPLVVLDMPRLMTALLARHAQALPEEQAQRVAWPCRGCGAPLAPSRAVRCERCHHAVVLPSVLDLRPVLDKAEPLLRAALPRAARPHGERLKALRGDPQATAFHRYLGRLRDMAAEPRATGSLPGWLAWALLAAALWFFWF